MRLLIIAFAAFAGAALWKIGGWKLAGFGFILLLVGSLAHHRVR